jgi:hypothetical protein
MPLVKTALLSLTAATVLAFAGTAQAATTPDAPWTGSGTATTTVNHDGTTASNPELQYTVAGMKGAWEFGATAKTARIQPVKYEYTGFHSWAGVRVAIERYVIRGGTEIVKQTLASAGPAFCCTAPSGGFDYKGSVDFDLQPGDKYGFRLTGSHSDRANTLNGKLLLSVADVTAPEITPTITGTMGKNGIYTSDVKVKWQAVDPDSSVIKRAGCDDTTVSTDTAGTTFSCSASSDGGKATKSVTIKRDATAPLLAVPGTIVQENAPASGAKVDYKAGVADALDKTPALDCTPASGSTFLPGTTNVECTARDAAGNTTKGAFEVIVLRGADPAPVVHPAAPVTVVNAAPTRINHALGYRFSLKRGYTQLKRLTIQNLPAGAMVTVNCRGASCPKALKNRTFTRHVAGTSLDISALVKGKLKPRTVITVRAASETAAPSIKKITIRRGLAPYVS